MFYRLIRRLFLIVARGYFSFRVEGRERMPAEGALVVVACHRSWLDPPAVGGACPRTVRFLIRDQVYDKFWARWFYRRMRSIPVTPGGRQAMRAVREALRHLQAGGVIGVFPEGRVVTGEAPEPFHAGAAMLAVRSGAPVLPLDVRGTARAWPKGHKLPRPAAVQVRMESLIPPVAPDQPDAVEVMRRRIEAALIPEVEIGRTEQE